MDGKFTTSEITKLLNMMIGQTEPIADSHVDEIRDDNLKTLIDVTNWCLDGLYDAARHRNSQYGSQQRCGERAYSALLEYGEWIKNTEEELA